MQHITIRFCCVVAVSFCMAIASQQASAAVVPSERVVVIYFHRTQRCPTCLKIGSYSEEAVKKGFAKQIKSGRVEFHYIDYQAKKNAAYAKAYKIQSPTLLVIRVKKNKAAEYVNLKEVWSKVAKKKALQEYIQKQVKVYCDSLEVKKTTKAKKHRNTSSK